MAGGNVTNGPTKQYSSCGVGRRWAKEGELVLRERATRVDWRDVEVCSSSVYLQFDGLVAGRLLEILFLLVV